jgi:hypothetical protein
VGLRGMVGWVKRQEGCTRVGVIGGRPGHRP